MSLSFQDVVDNILDTMTELDEEQITKIHNDICSRKIKSVEINSEKWEYTDEDDEDI